MRDLDFISKLRLAASLPSVYMWGTFGIKLTDSLVDKKAAQYPSRYSAARQQNLHKKADGSLCWAWDCAGLIKGVLWGWNGDTSANYGGGKYASNDVPDINVTGMEKRCTDVTSDFSNIVPGELVFMPGHVGVYIGEGEVIEATLGTYGDGVVFTKLAGRGWTHHGKFEFIEYTKVEEEEDDMKTYLKVEKVGLYVRDSLTFSRNKANGKKIKFCPIGGTMEILEFVPGLQADGYQWVRTSYDGVEGYSQYDSKCYYIFKK